MKNCPTWDIDLIAYRDLVDDPVRSEFTGVRGELIVVVNGIIDRFFANHPDCNVIQGSATPDDDVPIYFHKKRQKWESDRRLN